MSLNKIVISIGLIKDGSSYLCLRREKEPFKNYIEFPGGKLKKGESTSSCLLRELAEELDIKIKKFKYIGTIKHPYTESLIVINVFKIFKYSGSIQPIEGHKIAYYNSQSNDNLLPTHNRILNLLKLPRFLKILTISEFESANELNLSLYSSVRLRGISYSYYKKNIETKFISQGYKGSIIIDYPYNLDWSGHYDGVHFTSNNICESKFCTNNPNYTYSASCHNLEDIEKSNYTLFDFILLSPVLQTHTKYPALNWQNFSKLSEISYVPTYALGGVSSNSNDFKKSIQNNGFGIAGIRKI
tara:strand:+ start:66 stop:965 length:900 start_codon:yes stop_codon:yes gene_type:complete